MYYPRRELGFYLLYQSIHGYWSSSFYGFLHVVELLLDVSEPLLPRLFPCLLLIKDWSIASVVPTKNPLIMILSGGFVGIMLLGLASFSFSFNVSRNVVVLLFFLRVLHQSGEFFQVFQQTLVGETECLHLVSIGLQSFESVTW